MSVNDFPKGIAMNSKLKINYIFILFMLVSCSSPITTPAIQPTPQKNGPVIILTPSVSVLPSATITAEASFPEGCINLTSTDSDLIAINGFLIVSDMNFNDHLLDPKTKQFLDVDKDGNQIFDPALLSPNKKHLFALSNASEFILKTGDKIIRINIPNPADWDQFQWLDNEHVVFMNFKEPNQEAVILDISTGEQKLLHLDLPNAAIEEFAPGIAMVYYSIDPTLRRVFYTDQSGRLILWNMETQKELAFLPPPIYGALYFDKFMWSPDGTKVVTPWPEGSAEKPIANELYVFDLNGKLNPWTQFNRKYEFANVESPTWSPDGHHIGFWLKIGDGNFDPFRLRQWLAVLDTDTLKTTIYCLADKPSPQQNWSVVWSPDGQQLIVNFGSQLDGNLATILVDLAHQTQSVIDTQNMQVDDWMAP